MTAPQSRTRRRSSEFFLRVCLQEQPAQQRQHSQHAAEGFLESTLEPLEATWRGLSAGKGASPPRLQKKVLAPEELENPEVEGLGGAGEGLFLHPHHPREAPTPSPHLSFNSWLLKGPPRQPFPADQRLITSSSHPHGCLQQPCGVRRGRFPCSTYR